MSPGLPEFKKKKKKKKITVHINLFKKSKTWACD